MSLNQSDIINDQQQIADIAARIAASGRFAMDLEFMSADRYIPDLALIQLAWSEGDGQELALVEGVGAEIGPLLELVASDEVLLVSHGAKQDLSLLASRYQINAGRFIDTQIAAAFAGIAEQIGYARLVESLLGTRLDKGSQFTDWMQRPLSDRQLRYALDDVRYLLPVWDQLKAKLDSFQRGAWAREESATMAVVASERRQPDEAYLAMGGWNGLKGTALGALRGLAAWREELAVQENLPPSWIIPDSAGVEACRRKAKSEADLKRVRGIGASTVRKYGERILAAMDSGRGTPVQPPTAKIGLDPAGQAQAAVVTAIVAGRAAEIGIPPRSIAAKADAESLIHHSRDPASTSCRLLHGWRGEVIGKVVLDWLQGKGSVVVDKKAGVRVVA